MNQWVADLRFAMRSLRSRPLLTGLAAASLALAIAGNGAQFSFMNALLLRPMPYPDPERVVMLWQTDPANPAIDLIPVASANYDDWRRTAESFEVLAAQRIRPMSITGGDLPEPISGAEVTAEFFPLLGARLHLGRVFRPEEAEAGLRLAVLSHFHWQNRWGGDPALVGGQIELEGEPHEVVGVLEEGFEFLQAGVAVWTPMELSPAVLSRERRDLMVVGRLRAGLTSADAQREMEVLNDRLAETYPDTNRGFGIRVLTLAELLTYGPRETFFYLLQGTIFFILMIACANLANLLLARALDRRGEIAVRAAVGATPIRVLRQLLLESGLLAAGSGLAGFVIAWGLVFLLRQGMSGTDLVPRHFLPVVDASVVGFTLLVTVIAALTFGLAPSLQASRAALSGGLSEQGRGGELGRQRRFVAKGLVVGQLALALVLLGGAGSLMRAFQSVANADPGFDPEGLLVFTVNLPERRYLDEDAQADVAERLEEAIRALPGVTSVGFTNHVPYTYFSPKLPWSLPGEAVSEDQPARTATVVAASPAYFETLRSPLLQGRAFETGDRPGTPAVLLVSSGFAAAAWPGEDALGRQLQVAGEIRQVVGITGGIKQDAFLDATLGGERVVYLPYTQNTSPVFVGLARSTVNPGSLREDVRRAIAGVDRGIATSNVRPLPEMLAEFRVGLDAISALLVGFGLLALGLAGSGIYGVTRYSVSRRTREFGVRAAFGASPRSLLRLVMREAATLAGLGFLIGAPFMVLMVVFVRDLLTGFALPAPAAAVGVAVLLFGVSLLASWLPARRAARVPPSQALRV